MKNLLAYLLLAVAWTLTAQAQNTDIFTFLTPRQPTFADLGGESATVRRANNGPVSHVKDSTHIRRTEVFKILLKGGDYVETECTVPASAEVLDSANQLIPYEALNIFTRLEDLQQLAALDSLLFTKVNELTVPPKALDDGLDYPFVRPFMIAQQGLVANPDFRDLSSLPAPDTTTRKEQNLLELYHAFLVDPASKSCRADQRPNFFFDDELSALLNHLTTYFALWQSRMEASFLKALPDSQANRWENGQPIKDRFIEEALLKILVQKIDGEMQEEIGIIADSIVKYSLPFEQQYERFLAQYDAHRDLLELDREKVLFSWAGEYCGKTSLVLGTLVNYTQALASLPEEQTDFGQLLLMTELLALSQEHVNYVCLESVTYAFPTLEDINDLYKEKVIKAVKVFQN